MPGVDDQVMRINAAMAQKEREFNEPTKPAPAMPNARGMVLGGDSVYRPMRSKL